PQIDTSSWKVETIEEHIEEVRSMYLQWAGVE
ncbi:MAG TPA: 1-acyl-sn-glycerol-3-phosphate acyltransferase, partial [Balneola sp.]|nr:1-acyl-sn-glycerol-3-phosphate acyltransferase [Balneola sp.]